MRILLASQSPRRRDLVRLLGQPVETLSTDIDESIQLNEPPATYVARLSREKAQAASKLQGVEQEVTIIAADTSVIDKGAILGKPADFFEAKRMLQQLRDQTHTVLTGVTILMHPSGEYLTEVAETPLKARNYTDNEIEAYIATGDPFDKAGGYGIQHEGFHAIENFSHCFANVMGLPLCHLMRMLRQLNIHLPVDIASACQQHLAYTCPIYDDILNRVQVD